MQIHSSSARYKNNVVHAPMRLAVISHLRRPARPTKRMTVDARHGCVGRGRKTRPACIESRNCLLFPVAGVVAAGHPRRMRTFAAVQAAAVARAKWWDVAGRNRMKSRRTRRRRATTRHLISQRRTPLCRRSYTRGSVGRGDCHSTTVSSLVPPRLAAPPKLQTHRKATSSLYLAPAIFNNLDSIKDEGH